MSLHFPQPALPLMTFLNFTLQDPSPLISYSDGQWVEGSPTNDSLASNYSGSFKVTSTGGAAATMAFVGNSITIYGAKRPNHGNYSVMLDDKLGFIGIGTGDNIFQFPLWNAQNLTYGQHTAVLTNIQTHRGRHFLDVDFISIGREIGPSGYNGPIHNVTIDDESPFFVYNGPSWSSSIFPTTAAFNSSLHSTTTEGASVSFFFQGSSVELYGLYVNAPFQAQVDDQLPRNLAGPNVDLNAQQEHFQTLLYYMDGLDESKPHVVTLTNMISNPGRPLYIDYAVVWSSQGFFGDTPSPNPGFAMPTSTSTSASTTTPPSASSITNSGSLGALQSRPIPVGSIVGGVVGGIGGLIILAIIGFILLRRSRFYYSPQSIQRKTVNNQSVAESIPQPSITFGRSLMGEVRSFVSRSNRNFDASSESSFTSSSFVSSYSTETDPGESRISKSSTMGSSETPFLTSTSSQRHTYSSVLAAGRGIITHPRPM